MNSIWENEENEMIVAHLEQLIKQSQPHRITEKEKEYLQKAIDAITQLDYIQSRYDC